MFKNAIVKRPGHSLVDGITSTPKLGKPNYEIAMKQHDAYIKALKFCGVEVTVLQADERFPDSCFFGKIWNDRFACRVVRDASPEKRISIFRR